MQQNQTPRIRRSLEGRAEGITVRSKYIALVSRVEGLLSDSSIAFTSPGAAKSAKKSACHC